MTTTQLNIRIPENLKLEGDEVLSRLGKNATEAVRALWTYLATYQKMPDCLTFDATSNSTELESRMKCVERGAQLVPACYAQLGISFDPRSSLNDTSMQSDVYDELLEEYEALDA